MKTGVSQKTLKAMIHNALRLRAVDVEVIEHALLRRPRVVLLMAAGAVLEKTKTDDEQL